MDLRSRITRLGHLASGLEITRQHLWAILTGKNQASPHLTIRIETATTGAITRSDLRPDLWPPCPVCEPREGEAPARCACAEARVHSDSSLKAS